MSKVITYSRQFPAYHPKAGQPTYFVEKILNSLGKGYRRSDYFEDLAGINKHIGIITIAQFCSHLKNEISDFKHHTIRAGHRFKVGDKFSPRVWSGKPYRSKQIIIAPDIEVKKVWDFIIEDRTYYLTGDEYVYNELNEDNERACRIAKNDGLTLPDLRAWFQFPKPFDGQIICWNSEIEY